MIDAEQTFGGVKLNIDFDLSVFADPSAPSVGPIS
jgi:hypothetical protein